MAEYISFQPSDYFSTKLYTGNYTGGSSEQVFTNTGFGPDLVWIKGRNTTEKHIWTDTVRGATKTLSSSTTSAESTDPQYLKAFSSTGFTVGASNETNENTKLFVDWNWKAGTTTGIATDGSTTITPSAYSFNQTSGFSIVQYTGNSTSGAKVAHGLGAVPEMIIVKTTNTSNEWNIYHKGMDGTAPEDYYLIFGTDTRADDSSRWNDTAPDSVNFTLGNAAAVNGSANTMVAYCFAPKKGYSNFGSYVANNNSDGPFIYTGFRPNLVFMKNYVNGAWSWQLLDCRREGYNSSNDQIYPNTSAAEGSDGYGDLFSNGFKITTGNAGINDSGATFIYAAFAEFPIVSSNDVPTVAR
jgi:hypothetical protein